MTASASSFRSGLMAALPIVLGYLPIAFSFGVAASRAGLSAIEATFVSFLIYAGASQFLALSLLASGAPIVVSALTLVGMNLRHLVYGPALMKEAGAGAPRRWALIWGFGLTDEVFGRAIGQLAEGRPFSEAYMFGLGLAAYLSWVAGTAIGALAGGGALAAWPVLDAALGFMLTALFLALLASVLTRANLAVALVAGIATVVGTLALGGTYGLLAGIAIGALSGAVLPGRRAR